MIYAYTPLSFRLGPWTKASSSHEGVFDRSKYVYNASALLDYLLDVISDIGKPFVYRSTFSLINVVSHTAQLSFGKKDAPATELRRAGHLHFTFAFTSNIDYSSRSRPATRKSVHGAVLWSSDTRGRASFMTISIPYHVMRDFGLKTPSLSDLSWLYSMVGASTKNFVRYRAFYDSSTSTFKDAEGFESVKYKTIPTLLNRHPFSEWVYSVYAWRSMANVFSDRHATPQFCQFYAKNLRQYYKRLRLPNIAKIEAKVEDHVRSLVLDSQVAKETVPLLSQLISSPIDWSKTVEVEQVVDQILRGRSYVY